MRYDYSRQYEVNVFNDSGNLIAVFRPSKLRLLQYWLKQYGLTLNDWYDRHPHPIYNTRNLAGDIISYNWDNFTSLCREYTKQTGVKIRG